MKRRKAKGLSMDKGQFVKSIGYALSKGGRLTARRWYVGAVELGADSAAAKVETIRAAWREGRGTRQIDIGGATATVWADADPLAERGRFDSGPTGAADMVEHGPTINGDSMTVGAAAKMYLDGIEARFRAGQVSHAHWSSETFNLARGVALLGADKPLAMIGAAELTTAVLALAGRPLAKLRKGQTTEVKPISVKSARTYLASLKSFLDELSKSERAAGSDEPLWRKPLRFEDIFRDNQPQLTADEKNALIRSGNGGEADAFAVDELRALYSAASDRQRLWLLLALNCGLPTRWGRITNRLCTVVFGVLGAVASIYTKFSSLFCGALANRPSGPIWSATIPSAETRPSSYIVKRFTQLRP